jgi:hypothetical protein
MYLSFTYKLTYMAEIDEGSRFRFKVLYLAIGLLAFMVFIQYLQIASLNSNISGSQSSKADKYTVDDLKNVLTSLQNKVTYEVPSKWEYDNAVARIVSLENRMSNCKCW